MKKHFLIIAAISLCATTAEAHIHSTSRPNGSATTNRIVEKNPNGTTTAERNTEIEARSKDGDVVTIDREVNHEYDPEDNSVTSSKSTNVVSQNGSVTTINRSVEHEYNPTKKSVTSKSSTMVYENGAEKTHNSEREYTTTDIQKKNGSSTGSQPPVK